MRDLILVIAVAAAFAVLVTAQLAILAGLVRRKLLWKALAGLILPPLAVYWAWAEGMRGRATAFVVGAILYGIALGVTLWNG